MNQLATLLSNNAGEFLITNTQTPKLRGQATGTDGANLANITNNLKIRVIRPFVKFVI